MNSQGINSIVQQLLELICPDSITEHPDGNIDIPTQDFANITTGALYPARNESEA